MANVLIWSCFMAITGGYLVTNSLIAVPNTFGLLASNNVMMYAVVGGITPGLLGPILGSAMITFIPQYLRVVKEYEPITTSVAIILIIIFMSIGILGLIDQRVNPWVIRCSKGNRL
jgi:branched-chain amino acid transport system permease protein